VIGKVVASEDIPAATQLFTPNWIVKYLVQNTVGRQWLATYPHSALRQRMPYYIEPAEQTPEVQEQLRAITPTSLNPEEITLLDPACGSGHILVEAYDLFKAIYQERGYRAKDIPRLILQKNLFGLEIDDRAAQLAAFALMMKARADDRRIFTGETKPSVLALEESKGLDAGSITAALNAPILKEKLPPSGYLLEEIEDEENPLFSRKALSEKGHVSQADVATLLELFEDAKTFGSLIQVPPKLAEKLPSIEQRLQDVLRHGDLSHATAGVIAPLLSQARLLAHQYDAVVANPPYMGAKYYPALLKNYVASEFGAAKADLFATFIQRSHSFANQTGRIGLVTMQSWLFTSSYEEFRQSLLSNSTIETLAHFGPRAFGSISGEVVQVAAFSIIKLPLLDHIATYFRLLDGEEEEKDANLLNRSNCFQRLTQRDFLSLPRSPVAYWITESVKRSFTASSTLGEIATPRQGLATSDNNRFLRCWYEVPFATIGLNFDTRTKAAESGKKWFPYNKGGEFRKWYGNNLYVINWEADGDTSRPSPPGFHVSRLDIAG
jgi:type II restriction/modification system DNA methylase subunit YeeA